LGRWIGGDSPKIGLHSGYSGTTRRYNRQRDHRRTNSGYRRGPGWLPALRPLAYPGPEIEGPKRWNPSIPLFIHIHRKSRARKRSMGPPRYRWALPPWRFQGRPSPAGNRRRSWCWPIGFPRVSLGGYSDEGRRLWSLRVPRRFGARVPFGHLPGSKPHGIPGGPLTEALRKSTVPPSKEELEKAIIGTYSKETCPRTGPEKGLTDFMRLLTGITDSRAEEETRFYGGSKGKGFSSAAERLFENLNSANLTVLAGPPRRNRRLKPWVFLSNRWNKTKKLADFIAKRKYPPACWRVVLPRKLLPPIE